MGEKFAVRSFEWTTRPLLYLESQIYQPLGMVAPEFSVARNSISKYEPLWKRGSRESRSLEYLAKHDRGDHPRARTSAKR